MLFLLLQLGDDRYAIEAARVVEVLPLVQVKAMPHAPAGIAGLINYRGVPVPVVDLCAWALGRPARQRLSTRVVLMQSDHTPSGYLALMVEQATDSVRLDPAQFRPSGVELPAARYLGRVATDEQGGLIQWLEIEQLLPEDVRHALMTPGSMPV